VLRISVELAERAGTQAAEVLADRTGQTAEVQVSAIGGTLLLAASGALDASAAERVREHIERARSGGRPVVLDLSAVESVAREAIEMLRHEWRALGDRLRVVAPADGEAAAAIKRGGLRRFAIHSSLSGALTRAAE
jgi:anti-anti-sigma regulatory factor